MHIHLDPLGGLAGDMFLAAVVDAFPALEPDILRTMRAAGLPGDWSVAVVSGMSAGITGKRLRIRGDAHAHSHATGTFRDIRALLEGADLSSAIKGRAVDIFRRLAEVEAAIHGVAVDDVHFHEIADWDSIADIAGAAAAIESLNASWSVGDLPIGRGAVQTAHGRLPVPAPATARLLCGRQFRWIDDGVPGERVTPTGAAILAHLDIRPDQRRRPGCLDAIGHGLGTRDTEGQANLLRLLAFDSDAERAKDDSVPRTEEVGVVSFEIDDQTPEEQAVAVDHLRSSDDVLDVVQFAGVGKKGRMAASLRILCRPEGLDRVIDICFRQTTTIGLRWHFERRAVLVRRELTVDGIGAKRTVRPDNVATIKLDLTDLADRATDQAGRAALRRRLEEPG